MKDFAREVKQAAVKGVIERFASLPGHQAQIDWGECGTITVDGVSRRLYVFVFVLGYSRNSLRGSRPACGKWSCTLVCRRRSPPMGCRSSCWWTT